MCSYNCSSCGNGCSTGSGVSSSYSAPATYNSSIDSVVYQSSNSTYQSSASYSSITSSQGYLSNSEVDRSGFVDFLEKNFKNVGLEKNNKKGYNKINTKNYLAGYLNNDYKFYSFNPKNFRH